MVLHAHPDRWTVGLGEHLPPEERARLRAATIAAAAELLGERWSVEEPDELVEDTAEHRAALRAWRERDPRDLEAALAAAFDAVVGGAFWVAPAFTGGSITLRFHAGWRVIVDGGDAATVRAAAERHGLVARDR